MRIFGEDKGNMFILVTGGAASGKSAFAESVVSNSGYSRKLYIATMRPFDDECIGKIEKHHKMREHRGFFTSEVYGLIFENYGADTSVISKSAVIVECMSNYLNNIMFRVKDKPYAEIENAVLEDMFQLVKLCPYLTIVTNEIFSNGSAYSAEITEYIRLLGKLNRILAKLADEVYEVVCGIPVCLKKGEH